MTRNEHSPVAARNQLDDLVRRFGDGDRRALARLITLVENGGEQASYLMERLYPAPGKGHVIGITGPPGAGKSTLVSQLTAGFRARGQKVAVLAFDPSSPFSGGAVLGDRVRMLSHYRDPGVYIRSLATRGSHGGLSRAAREAVRLLQAFGFDRILVETAGVGQTELDIMDLADTIAVVLVPEAGDSIQVMKAGLNEIADVFVVNKSDREGAQRLRMELLNDVHMRPGDKWQPPVLLTQATTGVGTEGLLAELERHLTFVRQRRDPAVERGRREREFTQVLVDETLRHVNVALAARAGRELLDQVCAGSLNPYAAARMLIEGRLPAAPDTSSNGGAR